MTKLLAFLSGFLDKGGDTALWTVAVAIIGFSLAAFCGWVAYRHVH